MSRLVDIGWGHYQLCILALHNNDKGVSNCVCFQTKKKNNLQRQVIDQI